MGRRECSDVEFQLMAKVKWTTNRIPLHALHLNSTGNVNFWRWLGMKCRNVCALIALSGAAFSLFYFVNLISILTYSPIQIDDPSCSTHQKRSANPLHFEDFGDWQQFKIEFSNWNTTYQMRKPKKDVCAEGNVNTLIIVISKPDNFYAREQIRQTWMYDEANPVGYHSLFIIGKRNVDKLDARIEQEQSQFGDIIRYDYNDTYELLHVKTHAAFSWQQAFCPQAKYLLKTDDDTVVHLKRLDHFVQTEYEAVRLKHPETFFCNRWAHAKPFRSKSSRYYVPREDFPGKFYPTFCQGCSYMGSTQAISSVLSHTQNVRMIYLEDVLYTGIVVKNTSDVQHHAAGAFGFRHKKVCDDEEVPYLSVFIGVPSWKLDWDYQKLKNADCKRRL